MRSWYELPLETIPSDGASTTTGIYPVNDPDECATLMNAWLHERHENIELGLYLEQACTLLRHLANGPKATPGTRKKAHDLIQAIQAALHDGRVTPDR